MWNDIDCFTDLPYDDFNVDIEFIEFCADIYFEEIRNMPGKCQDN